MVTGALTRSEAESALRRLEGLRDDWQRQVSRWTEHYEKADNIKKLQQVPSAPLLYTVEACCNMMGIATIRYNELERLIQDFRACALYLVHLPIPEPPDATFRSALPDLWSIPHAAPGQQAVALPGQMPGFSAQFAPMGTVQGLSSEIQMYGGYDVPGQYVQQGGGGGMIGGFGGFGQGSMTGMGGQGQQGGMGGGMPGMMSGMIMSQQPTGFGNGGMRQGGFQQAGAGPSGAGMFSTPTGFNAASNTAGGYSSQPLAPQHTSSMYQQQQQWQAQNAQQDRVNQFSANGESLPFPPRHLMLILELAVFRPGSGFQPGASTGASQQGVSPLNPFNPNTPHQAVLDASNRYPAVQ